MLRKVIKLDEDGKEMVDENGKYIFEEIEIPNSQSSEEVTVDDSNSVEVVDENSSTVTNTDEPVEETARENSEVVEEGLATDSIQELLNKYNLTIEEVCNIVERFRTNLNSEQAIEQLGKLPEEKQQKILTSLGIDLKKMKIN